MELIETPIFSRQVHEQLSDDEYRLLQLHLIQRPDAGTIIPGSGRLRKLRWRLAGSGVVRGSSTTGRRPELESISSSCTRRTCGVISRQRRRGRFESWCRTSKRCAEIRRYGCVGTFLTSWSRA